MWAYVVRRIVATVPVMGVVALFAFALIHLSPADPAALIAGEFATPDDIHRIRAKLGLNEPMPVQFYRWASGIATGDLGVSVFSNLPVTRLIGQRIGPTVALATVTIVLTLAFAIPIGVIAAWKAGSLVDRAVVSFAVMGFSVPVFVLGYALAYVFAVVLGLLPVQGYVPLAKGFWPFLESLILPSVTLAISYTALIARMTRASMIEVLSQDYIRTARAKGLGTFQILMVHALKAAGVPIATTVGVGVGILISGVVVTESVFSIPGLGRLTVDAILHRDYPIIQAVILLFSGMYVLLNLVVDLTYTLLDPRIRY